MFCCTPVPPRGGHGGDHGHAPLPVMRLTTDVTASCVPPRPGSLSFGGAAARRVTHSSAGVEGLALWEIFWGTFS